MVISPPFLRCLGCIWASCCEAAVLISVNSMQVDPSRKYLYIYKTHKIDIYIYN